jgi:hypothetical protein
MKLLIQNSKIIATALDSYAGPEFFISAPSNFNADFLDFYRYENNQLVLRCPDAVTMRQARLALLQANLLDQVEQALNSIPDETQKRASLIEWEYAAEVQRNSPLTNSLSAALGLTEIQTDELFRAAAGLL